MIKIPKEELDFFEKEYLKRVTNEFNDIKRMRNSELRKYIENSNWSNILQIIRFLQDEIERLEKENNILTEFEKWLQDMYNYIGSTDVSKIIREYYFIFNIAEINVMLNTIEFVAHKLQELKEGNK